jgi:hypothetical protein
VLLVASCTEKALSMRKALVTAALAASLLTTAADAASTTDTDAIKSLDAATHQVTLADGKGVPSPRRLELCCL